MKKLISVLSIATLALTATVAFAYDDNGGSWGRYFRDFTGETNVGGGGTIEGHTGWACVMTFPERCFGPGPMSSEVKAEGSVTASVAGGLGLDKFVAIGTVAAEGSSSLVLNVQAGAHLNNVSNGQITVATNADTQTSSEVDVGDRVIVRGEILANGSLEADSVRVIGEENGKAEAKVRKQMAFGEITAVTDDSVTIKNNVTGETKTLTTNDDTKVMVNGEAKTTSDVQVGDKGFVKFKAMLDTFIATMIRLFR